MLCVFGRVFAVKHVNVCAIQHLNVTRIHVGSVRLVSIFLIRIMSAYVHRIIPVKIVELFSHVKQILVTMMEHVLKQVFSIRNEFDFKRKINLF